MQATEMKLLQPDDDAGVRGTVPAPEPQPETPAEAPQADATSELMKRAAAAVTEPYADAAPVEETLLSAASDLDDFLFAQKRQSYTACRCVPKLSR